MLHLRAAERRQLQQRINGVMDMATAHAGGKPAKEWMEKLTQMRSKL